MAAEEPNPEDLEIADELIAERRAEAPGETPEDMTSWQRPITAAIDVLNYRAGQIIALMLVPLIAVVVYEVISRNLDAILIDAGFGDLAKALGLGPTLWVYDTSRMIAGVLFMTLYLLFFIPSMIFFTVVSAKFWWLAYSTGETMQIDSAWGPLLWPARTAMPIGGLLLLLQGIPEIFRAFHKMGKQRERKFVMALPIYLIGLLWLWRSLHQNDVRTS